METNRKTALCLTLLISLVSCTKKQGAGIGLDATHVSGLTQRGTLHGSNGTSSAPSLDTASTPQAVPSVPVQDTPACFTANFHPSKKDGAHIQHDQNLIRLEGVNINAKSLCVRIDGTPARFKVMPAKKDGVSVLVGSIPNPNSRIAVRYCTFKATCAEDCTIPRDEFVEAITGSDELTLLKRAQGKAAKWDPEDNDKDEDATADLGAEVERELAGGKNGEVFEGWVAEAPTNGCGVKKAGL